MKTFSALTSRISVYGILALGALVAIVWGGKSAMIDTWSQNIFQNNYWPIAIVLYELFRKELDNHLSDGKTLVIEKTKTALAGGGSPGFLMAVLTGKDKEVTTKMVNDFFEGEFDKENPFNKK